MGYCSQLVFDATKRRFLLQTTTGRLKSSPLTILAENICTVRIYKLYTLTLLSLCCKQGGKVAMINRMNNYHLK